MAIHKIDGVDGVNHFPKKFVTLYCESSSISAGQWVMFGTDTTNGLGGSVKLAASVSTNGNSAVVGIATETLTAAGNLVVQTAGKYENAYVDTDIAVGLGLSGCNTTAGSASLTDANTFQVIGVALETEGTSTGESGTAERADVMIVDQGFF